MIRIELKLRDQQLDYYFIKTFHNCQLVHVVQQTKLYIKLMNAWHPGIGRQRVECLDFARCIKNNSLLIKVERINKQKNNWGFV